MGMTQPRPPRSPGRPSVKGGQYDPPRGAGRIGPIWDECKAQAEADGDTMTAFVTEAITRELRRRQLAQARREASE
jgi:hypothetical protein